MTCRYIDPANMTNQEDKDAAVTKGTIPLDSFEKYTYAGGIDKVEFPNTNADDTMLTPELTPDLTPVGTPELTPVRTPELTPDLTPVGTPESILSEPLENFGDEAAITELDVIHIM